jgi:hypothetical protein
MIRTALLLVPDLLHFIPLICTYWQHAGRETSCSRTHSETPQRRCGSPDGQIGGNGHGTRAGPSDQPLALCSNARQVERIGLPQPPGLVIAPNPGATRSQVSSQQMGGLPHRGEVVKCDEGVSTLIRYKMKIPRCIFHFSGQSVRRILPHFTIFTRWARTPF